MIVQRIFHHFSLNKSKREDTLRVVRQTCFNWKVVTSGDVRPRPISFTSLHTRLKPLFWTLLASHGINLVTFSLHEENYIHTLRGITFWKKQNSNSKLPLTQRHQTWRKGHKTVVFSSSSNTSGWEEKTTDRSSMNRRCTVPLLFIVDCCPLAISREYWSSIFYKNILLSPDVLALKNTESSHLLEQK